MIRRTLIAALLAVAAHAYAADSNISPAPAQEWGLVTVACASLRSEPRHGAELETQATMGTPVVLDSIVSGEWRMATMPDGYRAWIHTSAFVTESEADMAAWRKSGRVIVTHPYGGVVEADSVSHCAVSDVTLGAILEGRVEPGSRYATVTLPDGRSGYLPAWMTEDFGSWSRKTPEIAKVIECAKSMNGVTYLWGGTTPKAVDCSGFTQTCYKSAGALLPRNASAQAKVGKAIDPERQELWQPGDLLLFGADPDTTRITHVGIYLGDGAYIHCSGMVMTSHTYPEHKLYLPRRVLKVRRVNLNESLIGKHEWYF